MLGPVSLICVGVSAGKAGRQARLIAAGVVCMCKDGTAATTIGEA